MRVLSTFSGISAASVAWKPLRWKIVGYAEPDPFPALVLSARCAATPPLYLPKPQELKGAALLRILAMLDFDPMEPIPEPLRRHTTRKRRPSREVLNELWDLEMNRIFDTVGKEYTRRKKMVRTREKIPFPYEGSVPNFGDINQITDADLEALGPVDLLEGGSPCQAFSIAGKRQSFEDFRGNLMMSFCRLAQRMRRINGLKWILWENVKGVLSDKENGFGCLLASLVGERGGPLLPPGKKWTNAGLVHGPEGQVAWRVLDSQYFGVPQHRERVFALACLGDGSLEVHPGEVLFEQETEKGRAKTGKETQKAATGLSRKGPEEVMIFMAGAGSGAGSIAASTTTSPTLKASESGSNMVPTVAYSLRPDHKEGASRPKSGAFLAAAAGSLAGVTESEEKKYVVRRLQPVECERLQGFPDGWSDAAIGNEPPPETWRYKAIGNSMSVPVMRWIGKRLQEATKEAGSAKTKDGRTKGGRSTAIAA
ncbi:MAG: DNA cytosine methyltransferase [Rhizobiaceae bacterium]|nr:MAG: DNA cytosine methyltransferase [Rhizobiaceae bacterium]